MSRTSAVHMNDEDHFLAYLNWNLYNSVLLKTQLFTKELIEHSDPLGSLGLNGAGDDPVDFIPTSVPPTTSSPQSDTQITLTQITLSRQLTPSGQHAQITLATQITLTQITLSGLLTSVGAATDPDPALGAQ
ncbi:hypothetical protein F511_41327 [Dorcoceras hygrometricum]|uniref:Uncharacterized protein n=1 Tax=Dorcoceras hygrometricum TaxID=472368 RepID=A0A2Z7BMI9_9LAMI|nr:hypothetical protein F511_41327 [Dorcoceras hygrometricum]